MFSEARQVRQIRGCEADRDNTVSGAETDLWNPRGLLGTNSSRGSQGGSVG